MHIERFNLCAAILFLTAPGLAQSVDFDAPRIYQVENGPYSLPVGDFNGDGKLDLVAETGNGTVILLGNGDGTFQPGANVPNVTGNLFVVGDFNGDGKLDLATADAKSKNNVAIFLGNGDGTFQAGKISLVSGAPTFLAVGDFNGDGKLDLAVAVGKDNDVSILLGNGDGTLQPAVSYAAGEDPYSLAVADFNKDGKPDLAVVNRKSNNVSILLGNGDGTFQPPQDYATAPGATAVVAADFDQDGNTDLAVASPSTNTISILLGNGDGSFQAQVPHPVDHAGSLVAADMNGDGKPDLVVSGWADTLRPPAILLGNGDGTFQPPVNYEPDGNLIVVADLNGDGVPDLAVGSNQMRQATNDNVTILLGKGGGVFVPPLKSYPVLSDAVFLAVGDFNGDGRADLAVADEGSNAVSILLNNGAGGFQPRVDYAVLKQPVSIAVGDFNGDGKPDLAVAEYGANAISILLGNGDGTFRSSVSYGLGIGSPTSVVAADFNGDGKLDLAISDEGVNMGVKVSVLLGNGDGTFQPRVEYPIYHAPVSAYLAVADFNGDGIPDVAVVTSNEGDGRHFFVLPGEGDGTFGRPVSSSVQEVYLYPEPVAVADFNGDGKPDLLSGGGVFLGNGDGTFRLGTVLIGALLAEGLGSSAVGDFDGDGKPDVAAVDAFGGTDVFGGFINIYLGNGDGTFGPVTTFFAGIFDGVPSDFVAVGDFNGGGKPDLAVVNGPYNSNDSVTVLTNTSP